MSVWGAEYFRPPEPSSASFRRLDTALAVPFNRPQGIVAAPAFTRPAKYASP